MADIFISYKREDRQLAERLSIALEQLGFDVWFDFELLSGDRFRRVIEKVIDECRAVIVLWSDLSRESEFVVDEATYAKEMNKLCPARIDDCRLPLGFGQMHVDDLRGWDGELTHAGLDSLLKALETRTGKKARLGATARSSSDQERAQELEAFKAAEILGTREALRAFLRQYPKGAFAGFVTGQLDTMPAEPVAAAVAGGPPPRAEPPPPPPRPLLDRANTQSSAAPLGAAVSKLRKLPLPALIAAFGAAALVLFALTQLIKPSVPNQTLGGEVFTAVQTARAAAQLGEAAASRARAGAAGARVAAYGANRYEGEWVNGLKNGYGKFYWPNGDSHAGGYKDGYRSGPGVFVFADGRRYEGEFVNDTYNGYGALYRRDGKVQRQGAWGNGKFLGETTAPPLRGDSIVGEKYALTLLDPEVRAAVQRAREAVAMAEQGAARARANQPGARVAAFDASRYEGQVDTTGVFHGYGMLTWTNGDRHAGLYGNGVRNGPGVFYFNDGRRYEGEWLADKYGGLGAVYYSDGAIAQQGRWQGGELVAPMGKQGG